VESLEAQALNLGGFGLGFTIITVCSISSRKPVQPQSRDRASHVDESPAGADGADPYRFAEKRVSYATCTFAEASVSYAALWQGVAFICGRKETREAVKQWVG